MLLGPHVPRIQAQEAPSPTPGWHPEACKSVVGASAGQESKGQDWETVTAAGVGSVVPRAPGTLRAVSP